jgi:hypothetical protein
MHAILDSALDVNWVIGAAGKRLLSLALPLS